MTASHKSTVKFQYPPCVIDYLTTYLNRADVRLAIHATLASSSFAWMGCAQQLNYSMADEAVSMLPTYVSIWKEAPQLPILIFSGDVDGCEYFFSSFIVF
jgi:hypothetical protein